MGIFGRKNKKSGGKKYQNKALTNAQAREIERLGGTNPTGGASTTADTKKAEGSKQTRTETAADYRAKKKAELDAAKRAQVAKQKKVTADRTKVAKDKDTEKAMNTYKQGEQLGTPKGEAKNTKVTSDDKEGQARVAAGNKRAIANRKAKGAVKSGETYTYIDSKGKKQTVTKP